MNLKIKEFSWQKVERYLTQLAKQFAVQRGIQKLYIVRLAKVIAWERYQGKSAMNSCALKDEGIRERKDSVKDWTKNCLDVHRLWGGEELSTVWLVKDSLEKIPEKVQRIYVPLKLKTFAR